MLKHQHKYRMLTAVMATALAAGSWLVSSAAVAEDAQDQGQEVSQPRFKIIAKDPLTTPAFIAPLATKNLLTGVTLAGTRLVAVGEHGNVVYSDDQGISWQQAQVPVSVNLTAVHFIDDKRGWAVGHHGAILRTQDAGQSWSLSFDGMEAGLQVVAAAKQEYDAAMAASEALDGQSDDVLERLDMADLAFGDAKASIEFGPSQPLTNLWFENAEHGIVIGTYGQIFRTQDGGQNWRLWKHGINNPNNFHYYGITQTNSGDLYIVGEQGGIYRSRDKGESWVSLPRPYSGSFYGVISTAYQGREVVLVYGFNGHVFRSEDAGESWQPVQVPSRKSINGASLLADGSLVLTGASGLLLHSSDGGQSFKQYIEPMERSFVAVTHIADNQLALVGIAGVRLAKVDGQGVSF